MSDITAIKKLIKTETSITINQLENLQFTEQQYEAIYLALTNLKKQDFRIETPIISFNDGYSIDWAFCIPEEFKAAVDILPQTLTRKLNKKDKNGNLIKDENGEPILEKQVARSTLTQGFNFSFDIGDTLYCSKLAYEDYNLFRNRQSIMIKVEKATASSFTNRNKGSVYFDLYIYKDGNVEIIDSIKVNQLEFLNFLKTGVYFDKNTFSYVDVFKKFKSYNDINNHTDEPVEIDGLADGDAIMFDYISLKNKYYENRKIYFRKATFRTISGICQVDKAYKHFLRSNIKGGHVTNLETSEVIYV